MRRILRKVAAGEYDQFGDVSTLANPSIVEEIKAKHILLTNKEQWYILYSIYSVYTYYQMLHWFIQIISFSYTLVMQYANLF